MREFGWTVTEPGNIVPKHGVLGEEQLVEKNACAVAGASVDVTLTER